MARKWFGIFIFVLAICVVGYFILPGHHQRGHHFLKDGDFDRAIEAYERALEEGRSDADSADILQKLADLYLWKKRPAKAAELLERLVQVHPDNPEALSTLASAYLWTNPDNPQDPSDRNKQLAMGVYEKIVSLAPQDIAHLRKMTELYEWNDQMGKATDTWTRLIPLLPAETTTEQWIAAYEKLATYADWSKKLPQAIAAYEKLIELKPENYAYWTTLVQRHQWSEDIEGAIRVYMRMLNRFKGQELPEILEGLGRAYAATSQASEAIQYLEEYLAVRPENRAIRELVITLYTGQSQPIEALVHREYLAANFPDVPKYTDDLIQAYKDTFQYDKLAAIYEQQLAAEPRNHALRVALATAYVEAGRTEDAVALLHQVTEAGAADPEVLKLLARLYSDTQRFGESREALLALIREKPEETDALRKLAALYEKSKKLDEAAESHEAILVKDPADTGTRRTLVDIYTTLRRPDRAIAHAHALLEDNPDNMDILERLSNLYDWTGNLSAAAETYAHIVTLEPNDSFRHARLAEMYTRLGRHTDAVGHLARAVKFTPRRLGYRQDLADAYARAGDRAGQIAVLADIAKIFPDKTDYQLDLAEAYTDNRQFNEAVQIYLQLLETVQTDPDKVKVNLMLASVYERNNRRLQALQIHQSLLSLDPDNPQLLNAIGGQYMRIEDRGNARRFFQQVLDLEPDNLEATKQMATIAAWNNDLVRATALYKKFIARGGKDSEVHFLLGELYYDTERPALGYDQHQRALDRIAQTRMNLLARGSIARIQMRRGNLLEAIGQHETLVREYPDDRGVLEDYLETLVLAEEYERARTLGAVLTERFPNSGRGQRLVGRIDLETGRFAQAAVRFTELLAQHPNDPALKVDLARAYMEIGLGPKALPLLQQALASGVDTISDIRAIRDKYATSLSTSFSYLNGPRTEERFRQDTTFRHWLNEATRFTATTQVTRHKQNARPLNRKINDTIFGKFVRLDHDFLQQLRGYVGFGSEADGSRNQNSYLAGGIFTPLPETPVEVSYSGGRLATSPVEFLNFGGVEDRTAVDVTSRVSDRWRLGVGFSHADYDVRGSENVINGSGNFGYQRQWYGQAEYIWLDRDGHYLSTAYRFQRTRFKLSRGDLDTLVPVLISERSHTGHLRWEHQHSPQCFHGFSLFGGYDPVRVVPVYGAEGEFEHRFTEDVKGVLRARYLTETSRTGGGEEYEVTVGLEVKF